MCIAGGDKISLGVRAAAVNRFLPVTRWSRAQIANDIHGENESCPLTIIDLIGRVCAAISAMRASPCAALVTRTSRPCWIITSAGLGRSRGGG
jgi:hypothetical protein